MSVTWLKIFPWEMGRDKINSCGQSTFQGWMKPPLSMHAACRGNKEFHCPSGGQRKEIGDITQEEGYIAFLMLRADQSHSSSQNHVNSPSKVIP